MKVLVGLGNPGGKYDGTRHNIGFEVVDACKHRWLAPSPKVRFEAETSETVVGSEKVLLVWPQTYMNLSGRSVQQIVKFFQLPVEDVLVVCDDMNLKLAQLRLRGSGSAGGQKGLANIIQCLTTEAVPRLRVGVDRPPPGGDNVNYVLGRFAKSERPAIDAAVAKAVAGIEVWIRQGLAPAMNVLNVAPEEPGPASKP